MSDSNAFDRFDQQRKEEACSHESTIRSALTHHFGTDRLLSVETIRDGEYNTNGEYIPSDWLDYSGIDWLVDERPRFVPVGERLRPHDSRYTPDLSIRVANGITPPCERTRIADAIERGGLYPERILFGWYSDSGIEHLFILDTESVWDVLEQTDDGETHPSPGGATARYLTVDSLRQHDCICADWSFGGAV